MQRRRLHGTDPLLQQTSKYRHTNVTYLHYRNGLLFAMGVDDAMVSNDSGKSWQPVGQELKQPTVVDVAASGDSIITLSPSGVLNFTTNNGLSWKKLASSSNSATNTIERDSNGWHGVAVSDRERSYVRPNERLDVRDSMIVVTSPSGCRIVHTSAEFRGTTCIAASYRHIFLGQGRNGILTLDRVSGEIRRNGYDLHGGEFVRSLCIDDDMLYATISTGTTGVYRRPEYGSHWYYLTFDQPIVSPDVLCLRPTRNGVLIGMREQGIAFIAHSATVATTLHLGLRDAMVNGIRDFGNDVLISTQMRGPCLYSTSDRSIRDIANGLPQCFASTTSAIGSTLVVACQDGSVYRSLDTGRTWSIRSKPMSAGEIVRVMGVESKLVLLTAKGMWTSVDTGLTWQPLHPALNQFEAATILHLDTIDLVLTNAGSFRATLGGEIDKLDIPAEFEQQPFVSSFSTDGRTLYASGFPAVILSTDAGVTWNAYNSPELMASRCVAVAGNMLFVASADGFIYRVLRDDLHRRILGK